jgi:hypothetical protein
MSVRRRLRLAVITVLALTAACGDSATSPNGSVTGTFSLRTVNGNSLPVVLVQNGQGTVTVTDDRLTIADGGTWSEVGTFRVVQNGLTSTQTLADGGTWFQSGSSIVLQSNQSGLTAYSGTFTNTELMLTDDVPLSYVFSK